MQQQVVLQGITKDEIEDLIKKALDESRQRNQIIFVDGTYLYTWDKSDVPFVDKFTSRLHLGEIQVIEQGRKVWRNPRMIEWHMGLERCLMGEYITLYNRKIKPLKITRSIDRVPNPCLEKVARSFAGQDFNTMAFASIGDGAIAGTNPSPSDTDLAHQVARINVTNEDNGGDLSSDGNTFYCVAAFSVDTPTTNNPGFTESGIHDADTPPTGSTILPTMGDHSIFDDAIPHTQGSDAPGTTTFIYTCGS